MKTEQFIQGMQILRPYISPTQIAREIGCVVTTVHNYINEMCPDEFLRADIFKLAKEQFDQENAKRNKIRQQLQGIGIEYNTHE